ncbi:hypothetical protein SAMN02745823_01981 [Sporobacter termitidis DSM 10068]|uniref:Zinc-ribbon domain-containing protein n=1 Tax=Sporobacter termitidis DSM 10068 TaxID=1123282 RepID=A0A1M5XSJ4_9FIRM|nr:clostripain-related cysteine peptidase [Sporobacter termitidis]SHI02488.1 hypothetical protein SAMN02745823_01981 [Sporobacter termitidis DSM 10068]
MYCARCGSITPDEAMFCQNCGAYLAPDAGDIPAGKKNTGRTAAILLLALAAVLVPVILLALVNDTKDEGPVLGVSAGQTAGASASGAAGTAADGFRKNYTQLLGGGRDKATVMIYVCGSDLESGGGYATLDIREMLEADLGDNVNVVLETGGSTSWSTGAISGGTVQRWSIEDGRLRELSDLGSTAMLSPDQLGDFISFAAASYPANRYALVFWDHSGGSLYGYGADELYPDTVLFLPDIARALMDSGMKFDFVGFDACLTSSVETAYMLEPYADYLIGSEEMAPAYGWDYTAWLSALGTNTSIDTVELGKVIVDSFPAPNAPPGSGKDATLSVVALREIPAVYGGLRDYMPGASADH